jgi:hypothetical protein
MLRADVICFFFCILNFRVYVPPCFFLLFAVILLPFVSINFL